MDHLQEAITLARKLRTALEAQRKTASREIEAITEDVRDVVRRLEAVQRAARSE